MKLHLFHLSTWHYVLTIEHQGVWSSLPGITYACTLLQKDAVITQQGSVDVPAFTIGTIHFERSVALVVSRLSVVYYEKALSMYIRDLDLNASDIATLFLADNSDYERVALDIYNQTKLKYYRYAGPVLQNEYSTIAVQNIVHARRSLSYLLNKKLLPETLRNEILEIMKNSSATEIRDKLKSSFREVTQVLIRLSNYFSIIVPLFINHEPYSNHLLDKDTPFVLRTENPYYSILHIPRGINQIARPDPTQIMSVFHKLSRSKQNQLIMESGCTLSIQILSDRTGDTLNQQYPQLISYPIQHHFFLPTLVPLLLPYYNINRVFSILTNPHISCTYFESSDCADSTTSYGNGMACLSPLLLKPSEYIEVRKQKNLYKSDVKSVWLSVEVYQPLARVGYEYMPYLILSTAFSTHTLHHDDCKVIFDRVKIFEEQQVLYFCQGRLATEVSSSGTVLGDISMLKHTVLSPCNRNINPSTIEVYSLADAVVPDCSQPSVDESLSIGYVDINKPMEILSPFSSRANALEQQLSVIHAVYEDIFIAITAGIPAHPANNCNAFYSLSCEDSWRAYRLECFRYWEGSAPCRDDAAANSLNNYEALLETNADLCSPPPAKSLCWKPVQLSKKDLKQYIFTQINPLPLCNLMKQPTFVDKKWALQQQVILYTLGMEKRFSLSTGQIHLSIRLNYPALNIRIIRIEAATVPACGQFIVALVLVEDMNLSLNDYLKYLSNSIVFIHTPAATNLPSTSVYHCLFTFSLDGAFVGLQPLSLGGINRYYKPDDDDALFIRTLGISTKKPMELTSKVATAPFDSSFPVYTGPLTGSLHSRILSDVSNISSSISSHVYLCLRNLHLVLHLNVLTGEKVLIGFKQSLIQPYVTRFVVSPGACLPIFMDMKLQSILIPESSSSIVGELLSDYTDTEVADIFQKNNEIEDIKKLSIATYALEESDEIRTPGYCTDTSEGEFDNKKIGLHADLQGEANVRLSLSLNGDSKKFLGPCLFKPNKLSITHYSNKYNVSLIFDDAIVYFPHYPVAISRFHFKEIHLIAVIGQGKNTNYWGIVFTECTFRGSCVLVRQMVVDLGVPYICESNPVFNTDVSQTPHSSTGKISTATISCTGDSLIFAVPTKALMPGKSGQRIPATRLVEIGFYTEIRQIAEIAGVYRTHTPFKIANHQMRPV